MSNQGVSSKTDLLSAIEKAYKNYNLSLLSFFISLIVWGIFYSSQELSSLFQTITIILFIFVLWNVYRATKLLKVNNRDRNHPVLWVIAMCVPLFNIILILIIYNKFRIFIKELRG